MAAELSKIFFRGTYGHPHTAIGYAAYFCTETSETLELLESNNVSAQSTCVTLHELIDSLLYEGHWIACLPLVVLLEYIYAVQLNDPILWLQVGTLPFQNK